MASKVNTEMQKLLMLERELHRRKAATSLAVFLDYIQADYNRQWFHTLIAEKCQQLMNGTLGKDRLMLFVPPQHGKSEIVSRKFPAFALGINPELKIVGSSYSSDLAEQFSRSIQRTIDSPEYAAVFNDTRLSGSKISKTNEQRGYIRNVDFFETVGHGGFYKAVGIGGALTGTPADIAIIDDPIKDAIQASSVTYRDRVWSWYNSVLLTRLHNKSKVLLIQTRWHDDDLAGRLLKREADDWEVVCIPAIREDMEMSEDPREIGEALWEEMHSAEELRKVEQRSPRTFSALYQQRPTVDGGNIIKNEWFGHISTAEFNRIHKHEPIVFFVDTAYTQNQGNDPTGVISTCKIGNDMYITHAQKVYMEFPELIRFIPSYVQQHGYGNGSSVRIEPKANGLSVVQELKKYTGLSVVKIPAPTESKETKLIAKSPTVESGRVILVDGAWNEPFTDEVCGFPSKPHDEFVDVLCYACDFHLDNPFKPIDKAALGRLVH